MSKNIAELFGYQGEPDAPLGIPLDTVGSAANLPPLAGIATPEEVARMIMRAVQETGRPDTPRRVNLQ